FLDLTHARKSAEVQGRWKDRIGFTGLDVNGELIHGGSSNLRSHELRDVECVLRRPRVVDAERSDFGVKGLTVVERHALPQRKTKRALILPFPAGSQLADELV